MVFVTIQKVLKSSWDPPFEIDRFFALTRKFVAYLNINSNLQPLKAHSQDDMRMSKHVLLIEKYFLR